MDKIYAIIPVSKFSNAKTRLSPFLTLEERENLLKAMLNDVTEALRDNVDDIYIISADKEVLEENSGTNEEKEENKKIVVEA